MTNKISDAEARRLSGNGVADPPWSAQSPPNLELLSRSEGDLNRNSYRPSNFPRLSTHAVVNDDGTPITAKTEEKLDQMLGVLTDILAVLGEINARDKRLETKG